MILKNAKGSSSVSPRPPYPYTSWLNYWKGKTGIYDLRTNPYSFVPTCRCPLCNQVKSVSEFVGGHVKKLFDADTQWYITPICQSCNNTPDKQSMFISDYDAPILVQIPSNI